MVDAMVNNGQGNDNISIRNANIVKECLEGGTYFDMILTEILILAKKKGLK